MVQIEGCTLLRALFFSTVIVAFTLLDNSRAVAKEPEKPNSIIRYEHEGVPLYGYISDPQISSTAQEIVERYLASSSDKYDLVRAIMFIAFIDPEIVSEGKFITPDGLELSEEVKEPIIQKELIDEGCNVGRIYATNEDEKGDYLVWLVHGGGSEDIDEIESCLLFAAAASAGINLEDVPVVQSDDLRRLLDSMILGKI